MSRSNYISWELLLSGIMNSAVGIGYAFVTSKSYASKEALRFAGLGHTIIGLGVGEIISSLPQTDKSVRRFISGMVIAQDLFHIARCLYGMYILKYDTSNDPPYGWIGILIATVEALALFRSFKASDDEKLD